MRLGISLALVLLLFPWLSSAQIGFPADSVWLSDTKPKVGEKIRIYAVVYNGSDSETSGTLTFLVDGKENGSKDVSLESGESVVVASPWTAVAGEHSFSARFAGDGAEAEVQLSESIVATVEAPPTVVEETVEQAKGISSQIASVALPIVSAATNKVFETTEAIRTAGVDYFENKVTRDDSSPANVDGFETPAASSESEPSVLSKIGQTASAAALVAFRSLWLFYPILVGFLLLVFRWLYRWVTRPRF